MPQPKVETWRAINARMFEVGKALKWKWAEGGAHFRLMGFTELNFPEAPPEFVEYIANSIEQGYVVKDSDRTFIRMVCKYNPIRPITVGYIGRTKMSVYFPDTVDTDAILTDLATMQELVNHKLRLPFVAGLTKDTGEKSITARAFVSRGRGDGPPPALFTRTRRLLDTHLQEVLSHRQPVADWVRSKPVLRVPFASHNADGTWRTK